MSASSRETLDQRLVQELGAHLAVDLGEASAAAEDHALAVGREPVIVQHAARLGEGAALGAELAHQPGGSSSVAMMWLAIGTRRAVASALGRRRIAVGGDHDMARAHLALLRWRPASPRRRG